MCRCNEPGVRANPIVVVESESEYSTPPVARSELEYASEEEGVPSGSLIPIEDVPDRAESPPRMVPPPKVGSQHCIRSSGPILPRSLSGSDRPTTRIRKARVGFMSACAPSVRDKNRRIRNWRRALERGCEQGYLSDSESSSGSDAVGERTSPSWGDWITDRSVGDCDGDVTGGVYYPPSPGNSWLGVGFHACLAPSFLVGGFGEGC